MPMKQSKRPRRTYTTEFKQQIIDLYRGGKRKCDIIREYDIASSLLDRWISQAENSGSFKKKDNLTAEQKELIELRKKNAYFEMEVDILYPEGNAKQAALIMGRK